MKKSEIISAVNAINKIPLNKITDKDVRNTLVDDYLILRKAAKEIMEERDALAAKFREDWAAELPADQNGLTSPKFKAAKRGLEEDYDRIGKADKEVKGLKTIDRGALLEAIGDTELNFEDIVSLYEVIMI